MLQDNVFTTVIQSSKLDQLPLNTKIYNSKDFSDTVCVKLPPQMPRDMQLSGMYDLTSDKEVDFADFVTRDENRPWVDIKSSILDQTAGQHTYRMTFSKPCSKFTGVCWFGYIIQDNTPEKPYIYMQRDDSGGDDSSSSSSSEDYWIIV